MAKYFTDFTQDGTDECISTKTYALFYSDREEQIKNMHIHDCCEALLCLSNNHKFIIGESVYEANENDLFVVNQFEIHKMTENGDNFCKRYVFKIHPQFCLLNSTPQTDLSACFYGKNMRKKATLTPEQAKKLITLFESLKENEKYGDDVLCNVAAVEALVLINRCILSASNDSTDAPYSGNSLVHSVVEYINEHLLEEISLDEISLVHFVSKNHLCRIFKKQTGTTVVNYIILRRIAEAKRFLSEGYDVKETCEKCGFNDYSHFIRTFRKIVGVPPKQYIMRKEKND